jgi:hypothetical protein
MGDFGDRFKRFCNKLADALRIQAVKALATVKADRFTVPGGRLCVEAYEAPVAPLTTEAREKLKREGRFKGVVFEDSNLVVLAARKAMSRLCVGVQNSVGPTTFAYHNNYVAIEGMTSAVVCVVTVTGHGLGPAGTQTTARLRNIEQSDWINLRGRVYDVTVLDANSFQLDGVDTSTYAAYVPGTDPGEVGFPDDIVVTGHPEYFYITKMKWGNGGNDPSDPTRAIDPEETDEDLYDTLSSPPYKLPTIEFPDDRSVQFTAGLDETEAVGEPISEEGLTMAGTSGLEFLFARKTFAALNKPVGVSYSFIHTILY